MSVSLSDRGFSVRGLAEVAIRCRDLDSMAAFYRDALGLEPFEAQVEGIRFFRLGDGWRGHTAVLGLFAPQAGARAVRPPEGAAPESGPFSSLHHVALAVDWEAQAAAEAWLRRRGLPVRVETFDGIGWRGVFTKDPEGNTVELVAADPERRQ